MKEDSGYSRVSPPEKLKSLAAGTILLSIVFVAPSIPLAAGNFLAVCNQFYGGLSRVKIEKEMEREIKNYPLFPRVMMFENPAARLGRDIAYFLNEK